jgi:hypothetical protein
MAKTYGKSNDTRKIPVANRNSYHEVTLQFRKTNPSDREKIYEIYDIPGEEAINCFSKLNKWKRILQLAGTFGKFSNHMSLSFGELEHFRRQKALVPDCSGPEHRE